MVTSECGIWSIDGQFGANKAGVVANKKVWEETDKSRKQWFLRGKLHFVLV